MLKTMKQSYYIIQSTYQRDMASIMIVGLLALVFQLAQRLPNNGDGLITDVKNAMNNQELQQIQAFQSETVIIRPE